LSEINLIYYSGKLKCKNLITFIIKVVLFLESKYNVVILLSAEEEKKETKHSVKVVEEEIEEEEDTLENQKEQNIIKINMLVKELNRLKQKRGPDIRICPKCFSLRIKEEDLLKKMGIGNSYPTCICLDCGWRSNKWIYLDRTMSKEERETFLLQITKERSDS